LALLLKAAFIMGHALRVMPRLATTVFVFACVLASASAHKGDDKYKQGGYYGKIRPGDASSIQAALDAAPPGSTVTIPAGLYIVREPLLVRKNDTTIVAKRGEPRGCFLFRAPATADVDDADTVTLLLMLLLLPACIPRTAGAILECLDPVTNT
jgi:hypothetical protein